VNISKGKAADAMILSKSRVLVEIDGFMDLGLSDDPEALRSHALEFRV